MREVSRGSSKLCKVFIQGQERKGADKMGNWMCENMY